MVSVVICNLNVSSGASIPTHCWVRDRLSLQMEYEKESIVRHPKPKYVEKTFLGPTSCRCVVCVVGWEIVPLCNSL